MKNMKNVAAVTENPYMNNNNWFLLCAPDLTYKTVSREMSIIVTTKLFITRSLLIMIEPKIFSNVTSVCYFRKIPYRS